MPEGEVVRRIEAERAIIAPARETLMSSARDQNGFALCQGILRIGGKTSGIPDGGIDGEAGGGIANRHVTLCVNRDAGHPAVEAISAVVERLLLEGRGGNSAPADIELIPANRRSKTATVENGVGRVKRFRAGAVLVNQRCHQPLAE